MRYQGGKGLIAKHLAPVILQYAAGRRIVEPFCGGLSMTCTLMPAKMGDASVPLHTLITAVRNGWVPPEDVTREDYEEANRRKDDVLDPWVCMIGQCATWGGEWMAGFASSGPGIYNGIDGPRLINRNTYSAARASLLKRVNITRDIPYTLGEYHKTFVRPGDVIYCDPPYKGTTCGYPTPKFNHDHFWSWVRAVSDVGACVIVSEFSAPEGTEVIHERPRSKTLRQAGHSTKLLSKTEKLFLVRKRG